MFTMLLCVLVLVLANPTTSSTVSQRCTNETNLQNDAVTCFADLTYTTGGSGKGIYIIPNLRSNCKQDTFCDILKSEPSHGRPIATCKNPYCCIDTGNEIVDCTASSAVKAVSFGLLLYFIVFVLQTLPF